MTTEQIKAKIEKLELPIRVLKSTYEFNPYLVSFCRIVNESLAYRFPSEGRAYQWIAEQFNLDNLILKEEAAKDLEKNYNNEVKNLQIESKSLGFAPVANDYLHWFNGGYHCAIKQIKNGFKVFEDK